jgi:putative ATP-binding cassette transporter
MLSLGEQQRVAFARLLRQPAPRLVCLDEATSALDARTEGRLYALLAKRLGAGAAVVSVGHRPGLAAHHGRVLVWSGGGRWDLVDSAEYSRREGAQGA